MEREQVIKALECCADDSRNGCATCPRNTKYTANLQECMELLMRDALALIKELTEERDGYENLAHTAIETQNRMSDTIEELTEEAKHKEAKYNELYEEYESMAKSVNEASDLIRKLKHDKEILNLEIERLKIICESYMLQYGTVVHKEFWLKQERADTVRKMQEELKKTFSALCKGEMSDLYRIIDQIAKEMIEGETK